MTCKFDIVLTYIKIVFSKAVLNIGIQLIIVILHTHALSFIYGYLLIYLHLQV